MSSVDAGVLGEAAEALEIEEDRGRYAVPPTVGRRRCREDEEGLAGRGSERRQRARLRSARPAEMDAEVVQRVRRRLRRPEGHPHDTPSEILAVVRVDVRDGARAVGRVAVEDATGVEQPATGEIALCLEADVAVRHEQGDDRAFGKDQVRVAEEELVADRCLVLAAAQAQLRREADVEVAVEEHHRAGELRHDLEVDVLRHASRERRTHLAHDERVRDGQWIVEREPAVGLGDKANLEAVVAVGRLDEEALVPAGGHGVVAGVGAGRGAGVCALPRPVKARTTVRRIVPCVARRQCCARKCRMARAIASGHVDDGSSPVGIRRMPAPQADQARHDGNGSERLKMRPTTTGESREIRTLGLRQAVSGPIHDVQATGRQRQRVQSVARAFAVRAPTSTNEPRAVSSERGISHRSRAARGTRASRSSASACGRAACAD